MDNKTWLVEMEVAAGFVAVAIVAFTLMPGSILWKSVAGHTNALRQRRPYSIRRSIQSWLETHSPGAILDASHSRFRAQRIFQFQKYARES
jgi:hypothetical protein